ncbi:MAG: DUF3795 domain-containing protein [Desulfarculaceae bacterium]|nr:DUF3795 domain-containing protein [Desulfarculaceae bacterium]MCF8073663.1 DUF3795 domain-containing protein [Desulfarculaceae bacterium]MCF8103105.1 DUF3795 domain-containing protein [Desulfarculaceae bacterium]MCF8118514.1 DUF3795 domain-containing protein [Desulfarculaceae bacterium]
MEYNPDFAAPCGLYCGVCAIHMAGRDQNRKLQEKLVNLYKGGTPGKGSIPNADQLTVEGMRCEGCLSAEPFFFCKTCDIKSCTAEKGYEGCHQCDDFPCELIDNFSMAVGKKVILRAIPHWREVGTAQWIADEEARYHCPECGNKLFRGAMRCNQCKTEVSLD